MAEQVPVTMVNHVALEMAAAPDAVWREILSDYVEAKKFREFGTIEPLDDPAATLGGYRMRFEQDGVVDERIVHITERDDTARRLSVMADYLSVPGGMRVYATYHAREAAGGTSYAIDCHTSVKVDAPAGGDGPDLAAAVAEMTSGADVHLNAYLASIKARVEMPG
ncbi:SRPBCC family protein [Sphingopyxis macrogoltabida]|uniref:Uncharacterized protein n=1 Tax=Sphingopyxis macrogoltabida TaxID=33050 RepID=A0AAC8Z2R0_SPHMC|nr:hypothetical protein [Sphingopyxis macrogoltabida]ALJ14453.1 AIG2 family protein [Sphingopyxis macrogoltabida]AMU90716.1 hypothetical protein ATM17_16970 [Sphingopyxis macrogoltabida]